MQRREALKKTVTAVGATAAVPSLLSLLQSCQEQSRVNWQPIILSADQASLVNALVDTILPKTETPGGLDVKVDMFVDLAIAKIYDPNGQKKVMAEMDAFDADCKSKHGNVFASLTDEQKKEVLMAAETNDGKFSPSVWGTAVGPQQEIGFYRSFKSLILWGYFSSEEIGKNVLSYDPIPGVYKGCISVSEVGNTWSLG